MVTCYSSNIKLTHEEYPRHSLWQTLLLGYQWLFLTPASLALSPSAHTPRLLCTQGWPCNLVSPKEKSAGDILSPWKKEMSTHRELSFTVSAPSGISHFGNTLWGCGVWSCSSHLGIMRWKYVSPPQPPLGFETTLRSAQCMLTVMLHLPRYVHNHFFRSYTVSSRETYTSINSYWILQAEHWDKDVTEAVML